MQAEWPKTADARSLEELFEPEGPVTFGLEEEIMLLDPTSLDLLPRAAALKQGLDGRFKTELPASQIEIATAVATSMQELVRDLGSAREALAEHLEATALPAAGGVHPFSDEKGALNSGERYEGLVRQYGDIVRRQLVCGLHVHVRIGGAGRTLGVYNALRSYLPLLAALAANAPIYCGADSGMASVRPMISGLLPRQGIPPALSSWEEYAELLNASNCVRGHNEWWWELRPHAAHGTLEIRVADAQTTAAETMAICTAAAGLALWLAERHEAADLPPAAPSRQISDNRRSAARRGLDGSMADPESGRPSDTRALVAGMLDAIAASAEAIGGASHLSVARQLLLANGADRQRRKFAGEGPLELAGWLASRFLS